MKEKSIVLNVMLGDAGEILERGRTYMVKKQPDGTVHAEYHNKSQETAVLKLTLTALNPSALFCVAIQGEEAVSLKANAAGIFENRFQVTAGKRIAIDEVKV